VGPGTFYKTLHGALAEAAKRAGCSVPVTPHRLRHSFATEMLRLGVSLPALMQLLGHKDIRMTLRYVEVTQQDLHREFHTARQRAAPPHQVPVLSVPHTTTTDLPGIRQTLAATRHLLEYWEFCDRMVDDAVDALDLDRAESGFSWYRMSKLEHQFVNIRHIQHHGAQLIDRVRSTAHVGIGWVAAR
jgi:hypothetical protein